MSLVNLKESFLYRLLPSALLTMDERGLLAAICSGAQDRIEDVRAYGKKFELFFSPAGLLETGPNVVFVDLTTEQGKVLTRSLDFTSTTPLTSAALLAWAADQLGVEEERLANPRLGLDSLRYVDANILDYLASNIGAVLFKSSVAEHQSAVITASGTFTAVQAAHQKLVESYFPRLKFKGTPRSFEALGKLLGFDDIRMTPLWSRVSPHLPNDPGSTVNDSDFKEVPQYFPQQDLNPFYEPFNQRDGPYFDWQGTVSNDVSQSNYYPQVVNGFQPWVKFEVDVGGIQQGTITPASAGTYLLAGGSPHCRAKVTLPSTGTFCSLGEGASWNGVQVSVTELDGTLRRLDITDRLSAIKYRSSYYDLSVTMDADKADALFGVLTARSVTDLAVAPHAYVSWSGTLYGTSPFRAFTGGTATFQNVTGVVTADFLTPFTGTVAHYAERHEATAADFQQDFHALAQAGQGVTQALEEVRTATRWPRRASYGYLQDDTVQYAPIQADEQVLTAEPGLAVFATGTFGNAPLPPYTTGMTYYVGTGTYLAENTTDSRWPARVFHSLAVPAGTLSGTTVPSMGTYWTRLTNTSAFAGTVCVDFYGTVSLDNSINTHEVVRFEVFTGTTSDADKRYMVCPEEQLDANVFSVDGEVDQCLETADEYPFRRDILGGGELIETDYFASSGTAVETFAILEQTMAVKDQTEVDFDVYVAFGESSLPQFVIQPRPLPWKPGQRAVCFRGQFRNQALLTPDDLDTFVSSAAGRTQYFRSELDNVFQAGYELFHAGLVNGVLVADADKFNGSHHLTGLCGWLPFNEHPESLLGVKDAVMRLASQSLTQVVWNDRLWDSEQGFSLQMRAGSIVTSTSERACVDDLTVSFWIKTNVTGGVTRPDTILEFGAVRFEIIWAVPPIVRTKVYRQDGVWQTVNLGLYLTPGAWSFVYLRKQAGQVWFGSGSLTAMAAERTISKVLATNSGVNTLSVYGGTQGAWQIRDLRVWNVCKSPAEMLLVKYHSPQATVVPYRIGHVLSLNTGDRYGLQVLPNGWLAPSNMPAWVRTPKYAKVVRYDGDGEYHGESYRKEVGLGGGTNLPVPWKLGEQFYTMTADGTVVVSPQLGAMPGSNAVWQADAGGTPGSYIKLSGAATADGFPVVVTFSGGGANPWPNQMDATNPVRESIWLPDDDGHVYDVRLEAKSTGVGFVAVPGTLGYQEQGDARSFLATPGYFLGVTGDGTVVQKVHVGTGTTPPLYMYLNDTLLENVAGEQTMARWIDPSAFGLSFGVPVLQEAGALVFANRSTLRAGTYVFTADVGNIGKVDSEFDGFRVDITVADTTFSETLLQGYKGTDFRSVQELTFTLDHDVVGDWLLTFAWLNGFSDPARGLARQLAIYGYTLRRLETSLYRVSLAESGVTPVLTPLSVINQRYGTIPGGWLVSVNDYGTVVQTMHEGTVYPTNDTLRSRYPLANLLTGMTAERREDVLFCGTWCVSDPVMPDVILAAANTLTGTVKDSLTNAVVPDVSVATTDSESNSVAVSTDAYGVYLVEDLPIGALTITASLVNYDTQTLSKTIADGDNVLDISLDPHTVLSGRVLNSITSAGVPGVAVQVVDSHPTTFNTTTVVVGGWYYIPSVPDLTAGASTMTLTKAGFTTKVVTPTLTTGINTVNVSLVPVIVTLSSVVEPLGAATITGTGDYPAGTSVTLTASPTSSVTQGCADILFLVDESGSMIKEQAWLGRATAYDSALGYRPGDVVVLGGIKYTCILANPLVGGFSVSPTAPSGSTYWSVLAFLPSRLESALLAAGIGNGTDKNRYALIGFGADVAGHGVANAAHKHTVPSSDWGLASDVETAADGLVTVGGTEDGYDAIHLALTYSFRSQAAKMIILITDEGRDNYNTALNYANILASLTSDKVIIAGVLDVAITDSSDRVCIGRKATVTYRTDTSVPYYLTGTLKTIVDRHTIVGPKDCVAEYADLIEVRGGSEWDLGMLRAGGNDARAFTAAFVETIKYQIITAFNYNFDHWTINGVDYPANPLTFSLPSDWVAYAYLTVP